jgi:hypothetical protein
MVVSRTFTFAAVCGILAGLCIAVAGGIEGFTGETGSTSFVLGLTPALATPLLVGVYLRNGDATGRFGTVAYGVNLIGLGLFGGAAFTLNMAAFYLDEPVVDDLLGGPTRLALLGSAAVFAVGSVLFGVSLLRAGVFPRLAACGYTVAMPLFALLAPLPDSAFTSALHVLVGAAVRQPVAAGGRGGGRDHTGGGATRWMTHIEPSTGVRHTWHAGDDSIIITVLSKRVSARLFSDGD